jgi:hypothetical protein
LTSATHHYETQLRSLGFPLIGTGTQTTGVINLVLLATDFPGYWATAAELPKLKTEILLINKWLAFQSGEDFP